MNGASPHLPAIDQALAVYRESLAGLAAAVDEALATTTLRVLVARRAVARELEAGLPPEPSAVSRLAELDRQLQQQAGRLRETLGAATLQSWREAAAARPEEWWWRLDKVAAAELRPHPLWGLATGALFAFALALLTEIAARFLRGGPDLLSVLGALSQVALAALAGSAFTKTGREWIEHALSRLGVRRRFQPRWMTATALLVVLLALLCRLSLPAVAGLYNDRGVLLQREGRLTGALDSFRRALHLNPDDAAARYNLGHASETLLDYDEAIGAYRHALEREPRLYPAYNNLARLLILHRDDPAAALKLLEKGLQLEPKPLVRYALLKNRAWAHLGLGHLGQAEDDAREALELRPDGAAAHCLLAQVLEKRGDQGGTLPEWEACVADAPGQEDEVEPTWLGLAQERIRSRI